jgi:hypothetical protein
MPRLLRGTAPFEIDPAPGDAIFVNGTVLQVPD